MHRAPRPALTTAGAEDLERPMISAENLALIAAVEHSDPHVLLGPHIEGEALVIRVYRPDAIAIVVYPDTTEGGPPMPMHRVHDAGIFEATFPGMSRAFPYRLEVRYAAGTFELRDAYAFPPGLGDLDLHLVAEGKHWGAYRQLGAHVRELLGVRGTVFAVWAPAARRVSVTGNFNSWDGRLHPMRRMGHGIWEIFIPDVGEGALYKFEILTAQGERILKADPYGQAMELRPNTASKVTERKYVFTDAAWMESRMSPATGARPMTIYEVHLGSWRIRPKTEGPTKGDPAERWYTYRELAELLVDYVADMGFSHIELLPIMEHPFDGSWGYQVSGYFAPTSRYGSPDDLRYFIDRCHARGVGVLLDWTPAHFPKDAFALGRFDGTALYEHLDPRQGEHKHWNTYVFNYGRPEVRNFLISNALYWIEEFHIDGLRVDAVASMLYLDYGASHPGEWVPNKYGGRENLDAVSFLRELCDTVHRERPGALMIAEESTSWPRVTGPTYLGGLGFDLKWNMGWMHDNLAYFQSDPLFRGYNHGKLTFGIWYAYAERFVLPLSHDEVVHLKKSLLSKMPGDRWKMHANLRALYAYMWAHPGRKLVFMGGEIGQYREWNFEGELDWALLDEPDHAGLKRLMRDLNALYKRYPALHELDDKPAGFRWIDANDAYQSVVAFVRLPALPEAALPAKESAPVKEGALAERAPVAHKVEPATAAMVRAAKRPPEADMHVVSVGNFTPIPRYDYRIGVPARGRYIEVLNTDATVYGGSGLGNFGAVTSEDVPAHGFPQSVVLTLPPLAMLWLVPERVAAVVTLQEGKETGVAQAEAEAVGALPQGDRAGSAESGA
jgi:1,4-alpha-glucan branching enzyme